MIRAKPAIAIAAAIAVVAIITVSSFALSIPKELSTQLTVSPEPKAAILPVEIYRGLPIRLKIPAIDVDASIEYVGDTEVGDMAVPGNPDHVGWYKYGPLPGDAGSSVLAGHVVGPKGKPAIFINLHKLRAGDTLSVIDAKGQVASFTVREIKSYDRMQRPAEVFNSSGTHLNLITCAGEWDAAQRVYQKRLVVFTEANS